MSDWSSTNDFVDALSVVELPNVFNPYRDRCEQCDLADGPAIRRRNLSVFLGAALASEVQEMWVGLELGRLGGRRTGLPFTDELSLALVERYWSATGFAKATHGAEVKEQSACFVWQAVPKARGKVFLWNTFPFQCHRTDAITNRGHSRTEAEIGGKFLAWLVERMKPSRIVALGRDTERALKRQGRRSEYVRHPGRGGGPEFLRSIAS